jgi:hypothetical protein
MKEVTCLVPVIKTTVKEPTASSRGRLRNIAIA